MMRALSFIAQFLLLLVAFLVGGFLPVFHILPLWRVSTGPTSWFVLDGVFLMLALYLLLLLVGWLFGRFKTGGLTSTGAFLLALVLGLIAKFPFTGN